MPIVETAMKNVRIINLIDCRSLTSEERTALHQAIAAKAHRERAEFIRAGLLEFFRLFDRAVDWTLRAVFTPKLPPARSRHG